MKRSREEEGEDPRDDDEADDVSDSQVRRSEGPPSVDPTDRPSTRTAPTADGLNGGGCLRLVYGEDAAASVALKPEHAPPPGLRLTAVHELVTWVMTDTHGQSPRWAFVRHKPLVHRVVMLLVNGLDAARCAGAAELMPNIRRALGGSGVRTTHDNPTANQLGVVSALLCSVSDGAVGRGGGHGGGRGATGELKRAPGPGGGNDGGGNGRDKRRPYGSTDAADLCRREMPHPPSHYVLSAADMADMDYPVPVLVDGDAPGGEGGGAVGRAASDGDAGAGRESGSKAGRLVVPEGYVVTQPAGGGIARQPHLSMVAIDCEMCYTGSGEDQTLELTRASAVGPDGSVIYDKLVMPARPITNYNTAHSGITAEQMTGVTTTLEDVQRDLLELVAAETILVGHSLENDLKRLRLMHANCVDTAALYPHKRGPPYRSKLSHLTEKFLGRKIQEGTHDSVADARATMELALLKFVFGPSFGEPSNDGASVFEALTGAGRRCAVVDRAATLRKLGSSGVATSVCVATDEEAAEKLAAEVAKPPRRLPMGEENGKAGDGVGGDVDEGGADFVFGHLHGYYDHLEASNRRWAASTGQGLAAEKVDASAMSAGVCDDGSYDALDEEIASDAALMDVDAAVGKVWGAMPRNAMLVIVTGLGDAPRLRTLQERKWKRLQNLGPWGQWTDEADAELKTLADRFKCGMVYAGVKS